MEAIDVHKFGGSSLETPKQILSIKEKLNSNKQIVVVSAISDTTSRLDRCIQLASLKKEYLYELENVKQNHIQLIQELFNPKNQVELLAQLQIDINKIDELLNILSTFSIDNFEISEIILGYGEQWSAQIVSQVLNQGSETHYICAYDFLVLDHSLNKNVQWEKSRKNLIGRLPNGNVVITGYIAKTTDNKSSTLGRNGSDYSASIIANLVNAKSLTIWTDVDGVLSANPTIVPSAFPLEHLSYNEALELAYFGASVIHPKTMAPVVEKNIPVYIKNSSSPEYAGTLITNESKNTRDIKGITSIEDVSLITVEGSGMIGVSGIAARVFQTMKTVDVSVILITQSSSEHSICFAVKNNDARIGVESLKEHFQLELQNGHIQSIKAEEKCSIIAIVGDTMVGRLGIMEKVSGSLSKASVNIKAVAQGSSERNISVVVSEDELNRAIRAIHSGFHLSKKTLSIGIIGTGLIGKEFLNQLNQEKNRLAEELDVNLRVRGIMNSKNMILSENEINISDWESNLNNSSMISVKEKFMKHIKSDNIPHSVIVDCTASSEVASEYHTFLNHGLHIVTPNKKAHSSEMSYYNKLKELTARNKLHFLYETTVGAGLPIIRTLDDLLDTGDQVLQIEGIFSGTLAYLFDQFDGKVPFSEIVKAAKHKGFTEPDPREDLSGTDVARKVVILARQMGLDVSLNDISVESLVPKELQNCSTDEFLENLYKYDQAMNEKINNAQKENGVLRYVGFIKESGEIGVQLMTFDTSHPFGRMKGSDNIVRYTTRRYYDQPLIVQGPGAGAEVTAAGVFSDVLRLLQSV